MRVIEAIADMISKGKDFSEWHGWGVGLVVVIIVAFYYFRGAEIPSDDWDEETAKNAQMRMDNIQATGNCIGIILALGIIIWMLLQF